MSSLLVKDSPPELHEWLKAEAHLNRRSLSQQILVCLEWCKDTYGLPRLRNPFALPPPPSDEGTSGFMSGVQLAKRLAAKANIDQATAQQMKQDATRLRKEKARNFEYGCFA